MPSIAKVIEVIAESEESFDDAVRSALEEASKTVDNIKSIWVENMSPSSGSTLSKDIPP